MLALLFVAAPIWSVAHDAIAAAAGQYLYYDNPLLDGAEAAAITSLEDNKSRTMSSP